MKRCNKCLQEKSVGEFHRRRESSDGLQPRCKACACASSNEWNKANRDLTRVYDMRRHAKHRVKRIAAYRAWLERNPDKKKQYETVHNQRRRAQVLGNGGNHTGEQLEELFASYAGKCVYCTSDATEVDHIVPISKGGTNDIENLVPACAPCNRRKFNGSLLTFMIRKAAA